MKHALLTCGLILGLTNVASAQITEVHTRCGDNGSHFSLSAGTTTFNYQATISGCPVAFVATLEVYHNGILKAVEAQTVLLPQTEYNFASSVNMSSWGLAAGDSVTFRLRVVRLGLFGGLLASHTLTGDVTPP